MEGFMKAKKLIIAALIIGLAGTLAIAQDIQSLEKDRNALIIKSVQLKAKYELANEMSVEFAEKKYHYRKEVDDINAQIAVINKKVSEIKQQAKIKADKKTGQILKDGEVK
jgi:hypothetical protein